MIKSIFKEIIILIIIIAITVLALGIIFYQYFSDSSTVPSKIKAYKLEKGVEEELKNSVEQIKTQNIIKTYKVDGKDLDYYEETNQYNPYKVNPFSANLLNIDTQNVINNYTIGTGNQGNNNLTSK